MKIAQAFLLNRVRLPQVPKIKCLVFAVLVGSCGTSFAGSAIVYSKYLDSVTIINTEHFGHIPGSLEIKVTGGLGNPSGVSCDQNYVTTKNTVEGFKETVSVLLAAIAANRSVMIGLTDDAGYEAFSGRCSISFVSFQNDS